MIRVVLAVLLSSALLGVGLPAAERAERDRNAAIAVDELESLDDRAGRLAADNDPVGSDDAPAAATVEVAPPSTTFTDGGRFVVGGSENLVWAPVGGSNRSVDPSVPLLTGGPITVAEPTRLRLTLVDARVDEGAGGPVVRIDRPRVQGR